MANRPRKSSSLLLAGFVITGLLTVSGCGKKGEAPKTPPDVLFRGDMEDLRALKASELENYDSHSGGLFTQVFGGASSKALETYLGERLRYFVVKNDPEVRLDNPWIYDFNENKNTEDGRSRMGAENSGMGIWFSSLVEHVSTTFYYHGEIVPVTSPRVGIMLFGDAYEEFGTDKHGREWKLPHAYRQSILVHEARHSDCTGGITSADVATAGAALTKSEFQKTFKAKSCGHMHVLCPAEHSLHGLPACDDESWGAYTVGEIYLGAMRIVEEANEDNWQIVNAMARDASSRVLVSRTGKPDMTSQGLR